jgi:hypothetical protein
VSEAFLRSRPRGDYSGPDALDRIGRALRTACDPDRLNPIVGAYLRSGPQGPAGAQPVPVLPL